ncbi:MAG: hypothetical protein OXI49_18315 [Acidobacteriota bacterium]|nr:hypothetical protein [Acidobacteriota bacterium]
MALTPSNREHALQIQAGTSGRKSGHAFEDAVAHRINSRAYPLRFSGLLNEHLLVGEPERLLLQYIAETLGGRTIQSASALSTGALATSEEGQKWLHINGVEVRRCKSDILLTLRFGSGTEHTVGVSTKQCNNITPTNAQLFFTTARAFADLLASNGIPVSDDAVYALRQFCGDAGFRPCDNSALMAHREVDPRRFFWEETHTPGRQEWESTLSDNQASITRLLLQKAYLDDPYSPEFLLHKARRADSWERTEVALYTIDELVAHSQRYAPFHLRPYSVRKGTYKDPPGVSHMAPRFGIVQMQRGGQAQHPEQLQFNLQAGYFYKIEQFRP